MQTEFGINILVYRSFHYLNQPQERNRINTDLKRPVLRLIGGRRNLCILGLKRRTLQLSEKTELDNCFRKEVFRINR